MWSVRSAVRLRSSEALACGGGEGGAFVVAGGCVGGFGEALFEAGELLDDGAGYAAAGSDEG